ncbi:HlyD family efflux transporter periplasmic adaptor subunit [Gimesia aquarii]|uniref:Peptide zinc metalloprotease protein YydH n=1 Tax=Gimesia aquarii TaxID=2527964 RepID=A0A517W4H8_9PLAN|nr:HlyD family efflux transporter periplasmic adaptor subunit [Gimesia aquarii]QDU00158.1 Putative peptide zinc metalloprotease protein YydH [Gimesia aquarii]
MSFGPQDFSNQPLRLQKRADLSIQQLQFGGKKYWGIKDPISLQYYQLRDEEFFILQMLDGIVSFETVRREYEQRFRPQKLEAAQLQGFLSRLHQEGLIVADAFGQGEILLERRSQKQKQAFRSRFMNPLAIRFRGLDPHRFLNWLQPWSSICFSPLFLLASLVLMIAALTLILTQLEAVIAQLPDFATFFEAKNLVLLGLSLAFVKILHELGHAMACKQFGGECHELGVMLLAFIPCLYVNVSDAWTMTNKWHRIIVSAAGIFLELIIASICVFLWWFSYPGLFHSLCLNVVFICSVSTLLLNGNPLLRYDGYYILLDLLEVPNLRQRAQTIVSNRLHHWFFGHKAPTLLKEPTRLRRFLFFYGIASVLYRWFIVIVILSVCYYVLEPYGLEIIAQALGAFILMGMLVVPLKSGVKEIQTYSKAGQIQWRRFTVRTTLTLILLGGLLFIPLPHRITTPALIELKDAKHVYVTAPGFLKSAVTPQTSLQQGSLIAELQNDQIQQEILKLTGQINEQQIRIDTLGKRQLDDPEAAQELPTATEQLTDLEDQLQQRLTDLKRLSLRAPITGTVIPAPPKSTSPEEGSLPNWSGSPLDQENRNCFLDRGTWLCSIGNPDQLQARLIVDQEDVEFIQPGQSVRILLDEYPGQLLRGTIQEIAEIDTNDLHSNLIHREEITTEVDNTGKRKLSNTSYLARVSLDAFSERPLIHSGGQAKIAVSPESLGKKAYRHLRKTIRLFQ